MNKRGKFTEPENGEAVVDENVVEDSNDYTEDSFDKFLSNEESDLINNQGKNNEKGN